MEQIRVQEMIQMKAFVGKHLVTVSDVHSAIVTQFAHIFVKI